MRSPLRALLAAVFATGVSGALLPAVAQNQPGFPSKPIRLVTGSAGSQTDIVTRMIGSKLILSLIHI